MHVFLNTYQVPITKGFKDKFTIVHALESILLYWGKNDVLIDHSDDGVMEYGEKTREGTTLACGSSEAFTRMWHLSWLLR